MTNFREAESVINSTALVISSQRAELVNVNANAESIEGRFTSLAANNAGVITDIDDLLTADPNNVAIQNLAAKKDILVTEFTALKTIATAAKDASVIS